MSPDKAARGRPSELPRSLHPGGVGRTARAELRGGRGPGRALLGQRDAGMHQASLDAATLSGSEPGWLWGAGRQLTC